MGPMIVGLLALAISAVPPGSAASKVKSPGAAIDHLRAAVQAAQREDCETTIKEVSPIVDGAAEGLSGQMLAVAYDLAIVCTARANDNEKAGRYARRATALTEASDMAWSMRFSADYVAMRYPQAVKTLEAMTLGRGAALNSLDPRWLWGLHGALDKAGLNSLDKRLLTIMVASSYDPDNASFLMDDGRGNAQAILAGRLLAEGDRQGALKTAVGVTSVSAMAEVVFNSDLRTATHISPDFRAAAEADLGRYRELKKRYPDSLRAIIGEANTLRQIGRPTDAIAVLETARSRIAGSSPFADQSETLPWWWNELGYAHSMAGEYELMVAAFTSGSALNEDSIPNVSQVINLGSQQVAFGRYDDALRTVSAEFLKRDMSPFGRMQALSVRGCALALSGRTAEAHAVLQQALASEIDDPATVTDLQLCNGEDNEAAASIVSRLSNDKQRRTALKELARYADPVLHAPVDPRHVRRAVINQRPEVQTALAAAGGAVTIPLQRDSLNW